MMIGMLLADARLPTGAGSHSAGLEAAVDAGLDAAAVPGYIAARLYTVGAIDAGAAILAHRAARSGDIDAFERLDRAIGARTPSAPMRHASRQLGRGMVRTGARLAPDDPVLARLSAAAPYRAVATGAVTSALGADERTAAAVVLYDEAQTIASAALKLVPADPVVAAGWVEATFDRVAPMLADAVDVTCAEDLPARGAPAMELWIDRHSHERRRLFVS